MRRGLSLVETIVSIFMLLAAFLLITNLFQSSLRYESQIATQVEATHLADQTLRQMADYSSQYNQFAQMGASVYNVSSPYVANSGPFHIVAISSLPILQASPSLTLESVYQGPPDNRRLMTNTTKTVQVNVTWSALSPATVLVTQLAEPPRPVLTSQPTPIHITGPNSPVLNRNQIVSYSAVLLDSAGNPIPDVMFEWSVVPITGSGTIVAPVATGLPLTTVYPRDGSTVTFENLILMPPPQPPTYNPVVGTCNLTVSCQYEGVTYAASTNTVTLNP